MNLLKLSRKGQEDFINKIIENREVIREEYLDNIEKRTIAIPGYDEASTPLQEWRAVALWWDYKPWPIYQKWFPKTTELVREGPTHRASGWLILRPHSRTPEHNHKDWGHRIILHVPTVVPEGDLGFYVDGKIHRWKLGELFAFDGDKNHYGFNNTDGERSMMVIDFDYDDWIDTLRPFMLLED